MTQPLADADAEALRGSLLAWYDAHARRLAWRIGPSARAAGERPEPYRVWLSEVMLQQTTVPHATPYFLEFTRRWPTVEALAEAEDGEVMAAWAGLGYYARARNLLACARMLASERGGVFPDTEAGLGVLPGLGAYTAAAVAAIAFDRPSNVVDGNVERVVARLFAVEAPLPDAKPELKRLARAVLAGAAAERPGDWVQALMDLGATVCRPKSPLCDRCPVAPFCAAKTTGVPETYPRRRDKGERPRRYGAAFALFRGGDVALIRRPPRGLLGGMLGLPTSEWTADQPVATFATSAPVPAEWRDLGAIEHVFTHFPLTLRVLRAEAVAPDARFDPTLIWLPVDQAVQALPTVFRKALARAQSLV